MSKAKKLRLAAADERAERHTLAPLVTERDGTVRKFLGDVPWVIAGWFQFLLAQGTALPPDEYRVCGLCVKPADLAALESLSQP